MTVTANEQSYLADGIPAASCAGAVASCKLIVNAIHIQFINAILGLGLVSGDVFVSHSDAYLQASRFRIRRLRRCSASVWWACSYSGRFLGRARALQSPRAARMHSGWGGAPPEWTIPSRPR